MSPEQARGSVDEIDVRTDVFALGAILCGRPAYVSTDSWTLLDMARRADLVDAFDSLAAAGAGADLISLARDCLTADPQGRPPDAGAVADRMAAYLAGVQEKPRVAELAGVKAQARAEEERKRRNWQVGLAASLIALSTLAGLASTYWLNQQARASKLDRMFAECVLLRDQAKEQPDDVDRWEKVVEVVRRADEDVGDDPEVRTRQSALLFDVEAGLLATRRDRTLLERLLELRSNGDEADPEATDLESAEAFREAGLDLVSSSPEVIGPSIRARPATMAQAMAAGLVEFWSRRALRSWTCCLNSMTCRSEPSMTATTMSRASSEKLSQM